MGPVYPALSAYMASSLVYPHGRAVANGKIEKFNDHYQQRFLGKVIMTTADELTAGTLAFEQRHNSRYRYSKLGGKTPLKALAATKIKLRFPNQEEAPNIALEKPETGRYHLVRLIRSDLKLNIFGELFPGSAGTEARIRGGYYRCQRTEVETLPGQNPGRGI